MELPEIESLWDYPDPAGSEERFRSVLEKARESGNDAYTAELLTQIARAVCLQRKFDEAHAVLDEAKELLRGDRKRAGIRYRLERGRIFNDTRRTEEALRMFREAWEAAEAAGEAVLAADALHMIAYVSTGEESIRWHLKAIEFCRRNRGERFRRWLITLHNNIADRYEERKEYALGIESVEKAVAISEELGLEERALGSKSFLARLHRLDGDLDRAVSLIEEVVKAGPRRGFAYEEYAECLLATGREEEARTQFRKAYELLSKDPWYPPTEKERLGRIRRLAGLD